MRRNRRRPGGDEVSRGDLYRESLTTEQDTSSGVDHDVYVGLLPCHQQSRCGVKHPHLRYPKPQLRTVNEAHAADMKGWLAPSLDAGWIRVVSPLFLLVDVWHQDSSSLAHARGAIGSCRRRRRFAFDGLAVERAAWKLDWMRVHDLLERSADARQWVLNYDPLRHRIPNFCGDRLLLIDERLKTVARCIEARATAWQAIHRLPSG